MTPFHGPPRILRPCGGRVYKECP